MSRDVGVPSPTLSEAAGVRTLMMTDRHLPFPSGRAVIIDNLSYLAPDLMANDPTRI